MAVFGLREWWRGLRAARVVPAGEASGVPPGSTEEEGPPPIDDHALKAYAMQQSDWADSLIRVENARVDGEIRLLSTRLLLGTACGSVLLFSIAAAARVAPSVTFMAGTPLATVVIGALGAALVTALGAGLGSALRHRSGDAPTTPVNGAATSGAEPAPGPGSEPGAAQ
ncbi:hypothetical protein ACWD4G_28175 [Streptomyces sp. NPDC002643]